MTLMHYKDSFPSFFHYMGGVDAYDDSDEMNMIVDLYPLFLFGDVFFWCTLV